MDKPLWMQEKLEDGSPNPDYSPNWMNASALPETVFVLLGGTIQRTTSGIHLDQWLRTGGQIVPDPDAPAEEKAAEETAPQEHTPGESLVEPPAPEAEPAPPVEGEAQA